MTDQITNEDWAGMAKRFQEAKKNIQAPTAKQEKSVEREVIDDGPKYNNALAYFNRELNKHANVASEATKKVETLELIVKELDKRLNELVDFVKMISMVDDPLGVKDGEEA